MPRHVIACALTILAASGFSAASAPAASRPKTIASYCSPSGDVCFGVFNRSGAVYLQISTAASYFPRYRLCVRPPGGGATGRERCGSFPVLRGQGPTRASSVKYARQFPVVGAGTYRVTWKLGTVPLGPTLRFRLPLAA